MSDTIRCDGCGTVVERETLTFSIEQHGRLVGGDLVDPEGREHEWDHRDEFGDLCSECATPVIAQLNGVLAGGQEDD